MAYRILVTINGAAVEIKTLPKQERDRLAREWNRRAAEQLNYEEEKTSATV